MRTSGLALPEEPSQAIRYIMDQYRNGYYPTYQFEQGYFYWDREETRTVIWLTPRVIEKANKMLAKIRQTYVIEEDRRVEEVLSHLGNEELKQRPWVHGEGAGLYRLLATAKYLKTFEAVDSTGLAGAVLGVELPQVFLAETMVTLQPNASKAALCFLVKHYAALGYQLIDVQSRHEKDHPSARLFEETISLTTYLDLLKEAVI